MEFSEHDQKLIDESKARAQEREAKFFAFHKVSPEQRAAARQAFQMFLNAEAERGEKGFFDSPLGRKAFTMGYVAGGGSD